MPAGAGVQSLDPHPDHTGIHFAAVDAVSGSVVRVGLQRRGGTATWLRFALLSVARVLELVDEDAALPVLEKARCGVPVSPSQSTRQSGFLSASGRSRHTIKTARLVEPSRPEAEHPMQTTSVQITPADGCFCLACLDHDRRILLTARIATLAATSASCPSCAQIARLARAVLEPSPRVDPVAEA